MAVSMSVSMFTTDRPFFHVLEESFQVCLVKDIILYFVPLSSVDSDSDIMPFIFSVCPY